MTLFFKDFAAVLLDFGVTDLLSKGLFSLCPPAFVVAGKYLESEAVLETGETRELALGLENFWVTARAVCPKLVVFRWWPPVLIEIDPPPRLLRNRLLLALRLVPQ